MHKNTTCATSGARLKGSQEGKSRPAVTSKGTLKYQNTSAFISVRTPSHIRALGVSGPMAYGIPQLTVRTGTALNAAGA